MVFKRGETFLVLRSYLPVQKKTALRLVSQGGFFFIKLGARPSGAEESAFRFGDVLFVKHLLQFARFKHFHHYVATADEFAFDV